MSDPRNRLVYDPELLDLRQDPDGPLQVGTRIVEVRSMMGRQGELVTEVAALEQNRLIRYRTLKDDPMTSYGFYQFQSLPEGTQLTLDFTLAPKGLMKWMVPLISGKLKRDIASGLENIKATLEQE